MSDTNLEQLPSNEQALNQPKEASASPIPPQPHAEPAIDDSTNELAAVRDELRDEVKVGLYRGQQWGYLQRGREGYEDGWNREGANVTYNGLIASAIERAAANGRDKVVIFDFGCGEGNAMQGFLSDDKSKAMKTVKKHPDIKLKLIGLTDTPGLSDSPTAEELATGKQLETPAETSENVSARVDYYAVTAARTLEDYFVSHGIDAIDVGMAVQSLAYLPAKNFEAVMDSITRRLQSPGSTFIGAGYTYQVPGFEFSMFPGIDARDSKTRPGPPKTMEERLLRVRRDEASIPEVGKYLKFVLERYVRLGGLTEQEIENQLNKLLPETTKKMNEEHDLKPQIEQLYETDDPVEALGSIEHLITNAEINLFNIRRSKLEEQKDAALENLQEKYAGAADISFGSDIIRITNTESNSGLKTRIGTLTKFLPPKWRK